MKAIGIILAGGKNARLQELTKSRVPAAIPIASSYRAIDFALSNMSNSGMEKVAVVTQYNSRSLQDHLSSSKWWNFGRKHGGLFILTPLPTDESSLLYRGTSDAIYQNLSFLERSNEEYVVIANGDCIMNIDFRDIIKYHIEKNADITLAVKNVYNEDLTDYGVVTKNEDGRLIYLEEKPLQPETNTISIAVYVVKRTSLIKYIKELNEDLRYDFVTDLIVRYRKKLNIYCYDVGDDFYFKAINSIKNYFDCNMDFLDTGIRNSFSDSNKPLLTKAKDEPPVKYNYNANVKCASIGNGSIISGTVKHSILFRRVVIADNASVENSIIMEGSNIGLDCKLDYVIMDRNCVIEEGVNLIGTKDNPIIIPKNSVISKSQFEM